MSFNCRPQSKATEFRGTDEEDKSSQIEEESPATGHILGEKFRGRSQTTIPTYDGLRRPRSKRHFHVHGPDDAKPVDGPKDPHLFDSSPNPGDFNFEFALQMSPMFSERAEALKPKTAKSDDAEVRNWKACEVATFLCESGLEKSIAEKFENHDISGKNIART